MMSKIQPDNFNKRFDIVGCFIQCDGKFLLLRRDPKKANGNKWGLPAGKRDDGETLEQALLREVFEETGIAIPGNDIKHYNSLFVRDGDFDLEWHMFATPVAVEPPVIINPVEHTEYRWVTPEESLQMDLIHDLSESIKMYYDMNNN